MIGRVKLPPRVEAIPDRQAMSVQSALRQVAASANRTLQCAALEAYADSTAWATALTTTTSASYIDTAQILNLQTPLAIGDVLRISGDFEVAFDGGSVGEGQLVVFENSRKVSTAKPTAYIQNDQRPFECLHTVTAEGVGCLVVQLRRLSGGGNVYLLSRGSIVCQVWRA